MRSFAQKPKATQQTTSAKSKKPSQTFLGQNRRAHSILHLQRTIGNQAVQRLLTTDAEKLKTNSAATVSTGLSHNFSHIPLCPNVHTNIRLKLTVSTPGDVYEQEADNVADQIMLMSESDVPEAEQVQPQLHMGKSPGIPPQAGEESTDKAPVQAKPLVRRQAGEEEQERAQAKPMGNRLFIGRAMPMQPKSDHRQTPHISVAAAANIEAFKGGGRQLPVVTRAFFEPRFGVDFSEVRVHTDSRAAATTNSIQAKAFTVGQNIVFGTGQYAPHSHEGRQLLAHELTHVVQQNGRQLHQVRPRATSRVLPVATPLASAAETKLGAETLGESFSESKVNPDGLPRRGLMEKEVISRRPDSRKNPRKVPCNFLFTGNVPADIIMRSPDLEEALRALHRLPSDAHDAIQERRIRLAEEFESVSPASAETWYETLMRRDPTDADAQLLYERFHLLHTVVRQEMIDILSRKIVEQHVTLTAPLRPIWLFSSPDIGFKMNPAFWVVRCTVDIHDNPDANREFSNQEDEEASLEAVRYLNEVVGGSGYAFTTEITIADETDAASAIQDVWDDPDRYAIDCRLALNLIELKGIHSAYARHLSIATFNRNYDSFRFSTVEHGIGRRPERATTSLEESLITEHGLEEFLSPPIALNENGVDTDFDEILEPGKILYISNSEYLGGAWTQENAVYLGNNRFFGHPLGRFTPRQYVGHLRSRGDVQAAFLPNRRFPAEDSELMQHLYVITVARPRALPISVPGRSD